MDLAHIDAYLDRARQSNDLALRACGLVTSAFIDLPAHRVGVAHLFLRPRMILADPTGCGKTVQVAVAYGYLKEKAPRFKLLVVTGKSSQFQWRDAIHTFLKGVSATVIGYDDRKTKYPPAARLASYDPQAAKAAGIPAIPFADVWITTYAMLAKDETAILSGLTDFAVVFDEIHHIDNRKQALLYPACTRAAQKAKVVWGLSATPMDNGRLDEVYSLFDLLRPGMLGSYTEFRRMYFILRLVKPRWKNKKTGQQARPFYEVLGYQNLPHLAERIDKFYLRRPADQIKTGLPSVTFQTETIELGARQRALYESVMVGDLPGTPTKLAQLAAFTRGQQVLSAPEVLGAQGVPSAKLDRLVERLQTDLVGLKVIVYSKFLEVVRVIEARLTTAKILHVRVTGADSLKARDVARHRFSADPATNVILVTDAGAESLDLQAASVVVLVDLPLTHGGFTQVIGRARRIGSRHPNVMVVALAADGTLDDTVMAHLIEKERRITQVISHTEALAAQLDPEGEEAAVVERCFSQPFVASSG
jgi:SNF2 family DNA or RNA helicase